MKRLVYILVEMILLFGMLPVPIGLTREVPSSIGVASATAPEEGVLQQDTMPEDVSNVPGVTADWWDAVQSQIASEKYALVQHEPVEGAAAYRADNPDNAFTVAFSVDGVRLTPAGTPDEAEAEAGWQMNLHLQGYGYEQALQSIKSEPGMKVAGQQIEYGHAGLTEWYINSEKGLEQGFVLDSPPSANRQGGLLELAMVLESDLIPVLSDDAKSVDFLQGDGGLAVLRYTDLAVVDAAGTELAAYLDVTPGHLSIWIDDRGAQYPVLVDPVIITPNWAVEGNQYNARLGRSVSTAGDVNGDGYDDVLVGVPNYDAANSTIDDAGRVYLFYGSSSGLAASPNWTADGTTVNRHLGSSVSTLGDINADGYDDVALGSSGYPFNPIVHPVVYIYLGSASGLGSAANWSLQGEGAESAGDVNGDGYDDLALMNGSNVEVYYGSAAGLPDITHWLSGGYGARTAGDVNGDGFSDLVVLGGGTAAVYQGSATGLATSAVWSVDGNAAGTAGDVNGDGYDDVIVGDAAFESGQTQEGGAFVYYGSPAGLSATAGWSAESNQSGSEFGAVVGTAGDMNGDGFDDVIIGAPRYDNGYTDEGAVFAYYGSASGLAGESHWTAEGDQESALLGTSVATAGDVNGDSFDDVIVGAPDYDDEQNALQDWEGRAYLFLGPVPVSTAHQWAAEGSAVLDEFGRAVSTAGDVNGDGYSDAVVGAPFNNINGDEAGLVYMYPGGPNGLSPIPVWGALGEASEDWFGKVVGTAGDLNGDGYDDIFVGAPGHGGGKVYVYYGSQTGLDDAGWTAIGQYARDEFGSAVAAAGDVNRDGYDDLLVGASGYPDGSAYGKVYLYLGGADGLGTPAAWVASGPSVNGRLGWAVSTAGDVNADGYTDIAVGAPLRNQVYVFHGGPAGVTVTTADWTMIGTAGSQFGYAVGMAGDVNGDSFGDLVIGAPFFDATGQADAGRAYLYRGSLSGLGGTATWTLTGTTAGDRLGAAVSTAGDMNGDGYADVVVGVYGSDSLTGQVQLFQGSSTGLSLTPDRTISGEAVADRMGIAVAAAGDVNGDGYGDIIAGAPGFDGTAGANAGRATVFHGSANAPSKLVDGNWVWNSGMTAASAGDVNGDGYSDVVAGNENLNTAWVFYGRETGLPAVADWSRVGAYLFGRTVNTAGDVNGDGYADILVSDTASVHLFLGSATGLVSTVPDWSTTLLQDFYNHGAVGTAGDVNGDGYSDVVVGSIIAGTVRVYNGSPTGLSSTADWTMTGTDGYGSTAGTAGDVNGDGFADLVVTGNSTVYGYYGGLAGLATGAPSWSAAVEGDSVFPCTAAAAGDVNGDSYADVIVGAPYANGYTGKMYLFYGSAWGLDAPLQFIDGEAQDDRFGISVATAGDVNGDGFADILVGAPNTNLLYENEAGRAYLYYGSAEGLDLNQDLWTYERERVEYLGKHVAGAGDVNGDGFADVLVNAVYTYYSPEQDWTILHLGNDGGGRLALPRQLRGDGTRMLVQPWGSSSRDSFAISLHAVHPLGRGYSKLQVQACPFGVPFGDALCREFTAADWTEVVEAAGVDLTEMAEAMEEDTVYRWRARVLYDSPLAPQGPWFRFLGQAQEADVRVGQLKTDLRITMTMMPSVELSLGGQVYYYVNFIAAGGPAAGVVITDILPASLGNVQILSSGVEIVDTGIQPGYVWHVGDMAAGERGYITITAQANATRFVNIAEIGSTSRDINPGNNMAMVQTIVPGIVYVDADAQGENDGTTWVNAYTDLQEALVEAVPNDEIWVAQGVYKPTTGVDRAATFQLAAGVAIYGGFAGNEAYLHERDWRAFPTILDGNIGVVTNNADNVYHVVTASDVGNTAVLDGFVIRGGRATGTGADSQGAGVCITNASPTLRTLSIIGNTAEQGGGVYITGSSSQPALANLVIAGNIAATGGGIYNENGNLTLTNATLNENAATVGRALYNDGSATITNSIIWDNAPALSLVAGSGTTTITYSDVLGGANGTGNIDADPQFVNARGADGLAGTLDDDLRLRTTFRYPSPVIDQGDNSALPLDTEDLDGNGNASEVLPYDMSSRARLIGFTALDGSVDMGAFEANIEDVLAEGDAKLDEGISFRMNHLQLLSAETQELALQNYSNFNDGEWYYAFCSDYNTIDANGYCPVTQPEHVRNDLLDAVDVYRVAVSVWPAETWTTRDGEVIQVWQRGGQGVLGSAVEIGNDHLIFGNEYLVDATDYRFSTAGLPYADQIIGMEINELTQASRQFELVMDLIFRAFSEWNVGDYTNSDQFETFGVTSSLLMSTLDEMASRYYMLGNSAQAREVYVASSRNQNMHLAALAELAEQTGQAYLINGSYEMLNNVSRMRERARQIENGFDFFGFRPDYAPLQPYEQLLDLTEGPGGGTGLLGTARDLEDQARNAQRDYDTNASEMSTELDMYKFDIDEDLFELCGETEDLDGDGYGDYATCEGGLMAKNWSEYLEAQVRRAVAWNHAQNIARQIQIEQEQADQVIMIHLGTGRSIQAIDLAIGKLEAEKTTTTSATSSESSFTLGVEASVEAWAEAGFKYSTLVTNNEAFVQGGLKVSLTEKFGGEWKDSQVDTTQTEWDPNAIAIGELEGLKDMKEAEKEAAIEGANSAATIKNLLISQTEALEEWELATMQMNQVVLEHNILVEKWSRLMNLYAEAVPTVMTYNSHLLNPAYRLWRDSLTIQSSEAHSLAAQFAYLTARASEYELLTPYPNLNDAYKTRTANDIRVFLDELKVWHQALDLPGQVNRYPYTLSVAEDFLSLTNEQLDPDGVLTAEALAQKRYEQLQAAFASRTVDGNLEIIFSTSLDQQRPGGHFVFSPNIWNNRIAGIGAPLADNAGVRINVITTEPVNPGVVEVVLVHDGQATYRNAAMQNVVYDPATAVPVGYLIPSELSPAHTTVVLRPDINGVGGLANSGLVNLSVAASHWKLIIPAHSWGNLDVSQIRDIQIILDTTGRALPNRTAEAVDDAIKLEAGMEMKLPSAEWLQVLETSQQVVSGVAMELVAVDAEPIAAPAIPGQVSGSYYGNIVVTSPITIAVQELNFDLYNASDVLTGVVGVLDSSLASQPINLTGTVTEDDFELTSETFSNIVNGRTVSQNFTLVGYAEDDANILRAEYTSTITGLLPEPIVVSGLFIASRPGEVAGNGLLMEAGAWQLPVESSTMVTVTLVNSLLQPITDATGTVEFTTTLGSVVPLTVDLVDGQAAVIFEAGSVRGDAVIEATLGELTGQVRIEVISSQQPVADAGSDQNVNPGATVTLNGSGSSDPNGDSLTYHWAQIGGSFTSNSMIATFTAPLASDDLTFELTVTDPDSLTDTDTVVVTVLNIAPTANAGDDRDVNPGATFTLNGSGSTDPNGDSLICQWDHIMGDVTDTLTPGECITTFTAPLASGDLTFELTVTDPYGFSDSAMVVITVPNVAPVANAGPDQGVEVGIGVTLNGSGSTDPNDDSLSCQWQQTGGDVTVTLLQDQCNATFTSPSSAGMLTFQLTVTDTGGLSDTDSMRVSVGGVPPVANAGSDQTVDPNATVTLDGSGSSDPNGEIVTYYWVQTAGETVDLITDINLNPAQAAFTAPYAAGDLTFTLTVTDTEELSDTDIVTITVRNLAPTASAGSHQSVNPGVTVTLDGSGSSDPNHDSLTYHWRLIGGTFTADTMTTNYTVNMPMPAGPLEFELTVTDSSAQSATDTVIVNVLNVAPTANAGEDQQVLLGASVTLDGSGSSDPNGDTLTYHWVQTGGPPINLPDPYLERPDFAAPAVNCTLTFDLIVTDTLYQDATDSVIITVGEPAPLANAGPDQLVNPGVLVTLSGVGSTDPNNYPLMVHWEQTGGTSVISTHDMMTTTFTAPFASGPLTFTLTVSNTLGLSGTDSVVVTVNNLAPTAEAGPNLKAPSGSSVTLDGSTSTDPNDDPLACHWAQTSGPTVTFNQYLCVTTFTAPLGNAKLDFVLTVTDPGGLSSSDTTKVTVGPVPTADAGLDKQVVDAGALVTLDGSASTDPNGESLTYLWVQTGGKPVSFSPTLSVTTFIASSGKFTFTLMVTNTYGLSGSDSTLVEVDNVRIYLPFIMMRGPQAQLMPNEAITTLYAGSHNAGGYQSERLRTSSVQYTLPVGSLPYSELEQEGISKSWDSLRDQQGVEQTVAGRNSAPGPAQGYARYFSYREKPVYIRLT